MISPCIGIIEFGALLPGAQERDEIPALIVRRTALYGIDTANALFFPAADWRLRVGPRKPDLAIRRRFAGKARIRRKPPATRG
jgi:hypothetical protein